MTTKNNKSSINFLQYVEKIEDPRIEKNKLHSLADILFITLCGTICGAERWNDFSDFGNSKLDYLRKFVPLKNGIPSKSTFQRVISSIKPEEFKLCFNSWVQSIQQELGDVIAIDGKVLRRSFDHANEKSAIHMVSAFAADAKLVLAQQKVDEKSNEITAIPKLLAVLELRGAIVTIDAMGCQKSIVADIVAGGGDYVIAVKGNQGKLHQQITRHFNHFFDMQHNKNVCVNKTDEMSRGRHEIRHCLATSDIDWLEGKDNWNGLKTIIAVESRRTVKDEESIEKRYYISSLAADSENINRIVRSHWAIENSLHWVLDVVFREDDSRIRSGDGAENMATIKHVALNHLQAAKQSFGKSMSIRGLIKNAGWNDDVLSKVVAATI